MKGAPPQLTAGPPVAEPPGHPPAAVGERHQGTWAPPSPPPPLGPRADRGRPERQRPRAPPEGRLHPGGVDIAAAASAAARQAPPVDRLHTPALPATERQRNGGTQEGAYVAAHSEGGLGKAGARTRARRSLPPPSPPPPH